MRTADDITKAHDRYIAIILGEVPWPFAQERSAIEPQLRAACDVLCWVLGHAHNQAFAKNLRAIVVPSVVRFRGDPESGAGIVRFQLTADLVRGVEPAADNARLLTWQGDWSTAGNPDIRVFDHTKRNWEGFAALTPNGSRGWAIRMDDSNLYEIIWMEPVAAFVRYQENSSTVADVIGSYQGTDPDPFAIGLTLVDPDQLFRSRKDGAKGLGIRDPETHKVVIVQSETFAGSVKVTIDGPMDLLSADVLASGTEYWGSQQDTQDPYDAGKVTLRQKFYSRALTGAGGVATFDAQLNEYVPVLLDQRALLVRTTLAGGLLSTDAVATLNTLAYSPMTFFPFSQVPSPGPAAAANTLNLSGANGDVAVLAWDEGIGGYMLLATFAKDSLGPWKATAVDDIAATMSGTVQLSTGAQPEARNWSDDVDISTGDKILVWRDPFDGLYYCIKAGGAAAGPRRFKSVLGGTLLSIDPAVPGVGTITALDGGAVPTSPTVNNPFALAGVAGDYIHFTEDLSTDPTEYILEQIKHKSTTEVINVRSDDPSDPTKIEQLKRTVSVVASTDDSAYSDVLVFATDVIVTDVLADNATNTGALQLKTRSITIIPSTTADSAPTAWLTLANFTTVTDVSVDGGVTQLQEAKTTHKTFPTTASAGSPTSIIGLEDCSGS